jgi:hypothetical protein
LAQVSTILRFPPIFLPSTCTLPDLDVNPICDHSTSFHTFHLVVVTNDADVCQETPDQAVFAKSHCCFSLSAPLWPQSRRVHAVPPLHHRFPQLSSRCHRPPRGRWPENLVCAGFSSSTLLFPPLNYGVASNSICALSSTPQL